MVNSSCYVADDGYEDIKTLVYRRLHWTLG